MMSPGRLQLLVWQAGERAAGGGNPGGRKEAGRGDAAGEELSKVYIMHIIGSC
jgi:hypothetical protein